MAWHGIHFRVRTRIIRMPPAQSLRSEFRIIEFIRASSDCKWQKATTRAKCHKIIKVLSTVGPLNGRTSPIVATRVVAMPRKIICDSFKSIDPCLPSYALAHVSKIGASPFSLLCIQLDARSIWTNKPLAKNSRRKHAHSHTVTVYAWWWMKPKPVNGEYFSFFPVFSMSKYDVNNDRNHYYYMCGAWVRVRDDHYCGNTSHELMSATHHSDTTQG